MRVIVASHPSALQHDAGPHHPERPERVRAVQRGVSRSGLDVVEVEAHEIQRSELALVHDPSYIELIETFCSTGGGMLDADTIACPESWQAALTAAGAVRRLVGDLQNDPNATGFAITRPPGHHALRDRAMGFCLFNNVAVVAAYLRSRGDRVAIVDWDVHHGNGTQALLGNDPGVLYASIHQGPFYPYTGQVGDIDEGDAKGTTVNVPLPAGTAGDVYRRAFGELVVPVVGQFEPDWVLVSSGFDAHRNDPLADLELTSDDFGWLASRLAGIHSPNRTIVALEGGYDLTALEESTSLTLRGLTGSEPEESLSALSPDRSRRALEDAAQAISRHWTI